MDRLATSKRDIESKMVDAMGGTRVHFRQKFTQLLLLTCFMAGSIRSSKADQKFFLLTPPKLITMRRDFSTSFDVTRSAWDQITMVAC
jgi:hypothetical protein